MIFNEKLFKIAYDFNQILDLFSACDHFKKLEQIHGKLLKLIISLEKK